MTEGGVHEAVVGGAGVQTARHALTELWLARDVVIAFTSRTLRIRYRQAVLGALWTIAQPLALLVPFWVFLRDRSAGADGQGAAAATLAALVGWQFLSGAVTNGAGALVAEATLVRKTWFPREAPVLAAVLACYVELLIGLVLFAVVGPLLGARPAVAWVAVPLLALALGAVGLALAVPLAALNARYRDVRHALPFAVLLWLFVSPVVFGVERLAPRWRLIYALANPAAGPIEGLRAVLARGAWPDATLLAASLATTLVVGTVGHRLFRQTAPTLPDVI